MRSNAISTLRNLHSAQAHFQAQAYLDRDRDGIGEFGSFEQLAGTAPLDDAGTLLDPPILSSSFRSTPVRKSGYRYVLCLAPDRNPGSLSDETGPADDSVPTIDAQELSWCAYAWPEEPGPERPTLCVDESGEILRCHVRSGPTYGGARGPEPRAATRRGVDPGSQDSAVSKRYLGRDGNIWLPLH